MLLPWHPNLIQNNKCYIPNKYASVVGRTTYMVQKERKIKVENMQKERKIKVENIILKIYIPTPF